MHNYKELKVWKQSVELAELLYHATSSFPNDEKFGLTSQMRRSSVSVSSNIAEGAGRNSKKEFALFLGYAYGSTCELDTQLLISKNVELIDDETYSEILLQINSIQKMIFSLKKSLS